MSPTDTIGILKDHSFQKLKANWFHKYLGENGYPSRTYYNIVQETFME